MDAFITKLTNHAEHIKRVGHLCSSEETTKQALILPMLDILGFHAYDPTRVKAEFKADFKGAKSGEKVDYALFCENRLVMLVEAKSYTQNLSNHDAQLSRYFNSSVDVKVAVITNGREWRFFTDLAEKNVMDNEPFLTVNFSNKNTSVYSQLHHFHHDEFQPDTLRALAEENNYLSIFEKIISKSLRENHVDFVRYVAQQANLQRQLNTKLLESLTPLIKQATQNAIADMVIIGFMSNDKHENQTVVGFPYTDEVNPTNSKIITTAIEKKLFALTQKILGDDADIVMRDTESYFAVLHQGKVNRWLYRYYGDKKTPTIQLIIEVENVPSLCAEVERVGLTMLHGHIVLAAPDDILRIPQIIKDCYTYCQNDENFKVKTKA